MMLPGPADIIGIILMLASGLLTLWAVVDSARRQRYGWTVAALVLPLLYLNFGRHRAPGESLDGGAPSKR